MRILLRRRVRDEVLIQLVLLILHGSVNAERLNYGVANYVWLVEEALVTVGHLRLLASPAAALLLHRVLLGCIHHLRCQA